MARCTVLGNKGARVSTVEHLLSALAGLGVSDLVVEVDGPELPIGDGSALVWVERIGAAGIVELNTKAAPLIVTEPVVVFGEKGAFVAAYPSDAVRFTVVTQFDHPLAGMQVARWEPERNQAYVDWVAPARTFGFDFEIEALRAAGLVRGGTLDNALVVYADRYSSPPRFPDELARHKLLDLVGDLVLAGRPVLADVIAVKPGHRLNVALARRLQET
jgi:UDP-3-O-[3-hydroxymyristoyl] N-acetylglucosamine deacetylase